MWFEAISSLSINLNKSEILLVRVENVEVLASKLGCKVGSLPSIYLGLPLGAPHKSVAVWDGVEETCFVEESVHFQGGENHSHSEHVG